MNRKKFGKNNCISRRTKVTTSRSLLRINQAEKKEMEKATKQGQSLFHAIFYFLFKVLTFIFPFFGQRNSNNASSASLLEIQDLREKLEKLETNFEKLTKQLNKAQKKLNKEKSSVVVKESVPTSFKIPPPPMLSSSIPPPPLLSTSVMPKTTPSLSLKVKRGFSITDIQNVQLRKTEGTAKKASNAKQSGSRQLVSLKDLQNVKLKSRKVKSDENHNDILNGLPIKPSFSNTLKKTNVVRSPGGTPLVKRDTNQSTATGLTPAFTRALHNKFKSVKVSPIPISDIQDSSPNRWRC